MLPTLRLAPRSRRGPRIAGGLGTLALALLLPALSVAPVSAGTPMAVPGFELVDVDLERPTQIHSDAAGNLYVYDMPRNLILRITPAGLTSVVVGNGEQGLIQAGPATATPLGWIEDMAVGPDGTLYLVDHTAYAVAVVSPAGDLRLVGERWGTTSGIGVDAAGNIYVADCGRDAISRISPDGTTTVLLDRASGVPGWRGQFHPETIEVTPDGSVIVEDTGNYVLDRIAPDGTTTIVAGTGEEWDRPLPGPATETTVYVQSMTVAPDGTLYFLGHAEGIGRITPDGDLSLLRLPKDEDGLPVRGYSIGMAADGRIVLRILDEPGLWLVDPDNLTTYDPRVPEDPWGGRTMATFGSGYQTRVTAGRTWRANVGLYDDETGQRATGTVHLVVKGKALPPVELVDGAASLRTKLPWKRGTHTIEAYYSGDESFLESRRSFEVEVLKRKKRPG